MTPLCLLVILVVIVALIFDYSNGFHDAANSIATVVATRVLKPFQAVLWAATFNFLAAFTLHTGVAETTGKGIVPLEFVNVQVILSCLIGAISWNVITWYYGLPSSSSHALMGGLLGAAMVRGWEKVTQEGPGVVIGEKVGRTLAFIVVSPMLGMILGVTLMTIAVALVKNARPGPANLWSRRLQLVSSGLYSLGHGMNDAQKTMGIIAALLVSMRSTVPELQDAPAWMMPTADLKHVPLWIVLAACGAISLGTMSGGWRIVKTMGMKITELQPLGGVCAETAGAITLIGVSLLKIPVSTTHTITGAIAGVGASRRLSAVRWGVAKNIVWAWILTIPAAGLLAALAYLVVGVLWPVLPMPGQVALALAALGGLVYGGVAWLKLSKTEGAGAH